MTAIRTILCPTDFSEPAACAFSLAAALARDHGARLVLLHVPEPPPGVRPGELERTLTRPDGYRRDLEDRLRAFQAPGVKIDYQLGEGAPAQEVLRVAAEMGCDLIVMGTHGRTGLSRVLLGSAAEQVLRRATCPVLTVHAPPAPRRQQAGEN